MPRKYGAYVTAWPRLKRWQEEGVWIRIWQAFLSSLDEEGKLLWSRAFLDGGFLPAKKGRRDRNDRGEKGTKRMLVVDGNGIPLAPSISRAGLR